MEWARPKPINMQSLRETINIVPNAEHFKAVNGNANLLEFSCVPKSKVTLAKYIESIKRQEFPEHLKSSEDPPIIVDHYWSDKGVCIQKQILYGSDVEMSFFDNSVKEWNLNRIAALLNRVKNESGSKVSGIHTPYVYFGSAYSSFPFHCEDYGLPSINFHHYGERKIWIHIDERYSKKLEEEIHSMIPDIEKRCDVFMRHKIFLAGL